MVSVVQRLRVEHGTAERVRQTPEPRVAILLMPVLALSGSRGMNRTDRMQPCSEDRTDFSVRFFRIEYRHAGLSDFRTESSLLAPLVRHELLKQ